jgi:hypothetical protein
VILCTDGLANKGVGQLEDVVSEVSAKLFYTECGEQAMLHGLTVNVISLIGMLRKILRMIRMNSRDLNFNIETELVFLFECSVSHA